jgi:GTP-binding protein
MAQTKYVLSRALNLGLKPMVVLNKVDRSDGWNRIESGETESKLLDLVDILGASDDQMEYLTLYASVHGGWVTDDQDIASTIVHDGCESCKEEMGMTRLLDRILEIVPEPMVHSYDDASQRQSSSKARSFLLAGPGVRSPT